MKKFLFAFAVLSFLWSSCEKEKNNSDACNAPFKISELKNNGVTWEQVIYNSECNVFEHIEAFSYQKFTYNAENELKKKEVALLLNPMSCFMPAPGEVYEDPRTAPITEYYEYEYNNEGMLQKRLRYFNTGESFNLFAYQTFEYENNKVKTIYNYNPENVLTEKSIYYYDINGNVTKEEYYTVDAQDVHMNTIEYEYDDKNNPYQAFPFEGTPGKFTNKNNILKTTYINEYQGQTHQNTLEFTYEYDSFGYPVKIDNFIVLY